MSDDDAEPDVNISGGSAGGGVEATFDPATAGTRAEAVVDRLGELYWQKAYGGRDGFECLVRTILSQNTSDVASQPAHDALVERFGPVEELAANLVDAPRDELAETISSAGLYNQKAESIQRAAEWVLDAFGSTTDFDAFVRDGDPGEVRETLLELKGVGPKTADCVLLFAGGQGGVFPVDTHVHRIYRRMGIAPPDADHEAVRAVLEREVPAEKCGFGHTATIQFGREYCTARKPACLDDPDACPLADACDQVGVYPVTGEVEDPSEAAD
ncbi:endonuclease III [Halorubellus sp. JP-L1]|uniref:endonuclease III domain-containing protein n=1 Tax=Halorubellus sp. JP-L1 TaxID=2715753 RepID=UPI0014097DCC|nr:endonuclease III [Halorubellus sp. JP-L1]NHN42455.1 endonuclease III [Halorubellus sp. JP-L1]